MADTGDCAESTLCVTGSVQVTLDQDVDAAVERGREEHPLAAARGWSSSRLTAGRKPRSAMWSASSSTVISTASTDGVAGCDVVLQPAGAGDDDVDALAQLGDLRARADTAEDGDGRAGSSPRPAGPAPPRSGRRARGSGPGSARAGDPARAAVWLGGEPGQHGQQEGVGLARSRCGHGRARRGRPASRAASPPGSGTAW